MKCKCKGELKPAGYPTFGLICSRCALLHNKNGTEMIPYKLEPQRSFTSEEREALRKEVSEL